MGDRLEERKDFTPEVSAKLPEAKKLAEVSQHSPINELLRHGRGS